MLEVRSALSILLALCFVFHIFSQTGKASSTLLATSAFAFLMLVVRSEVSVTLAFTKGFNHLAGVVLGVVKEVRSTDSDVYFFPHISFQVIIQSYQSATIAFDKFFQVLPQYLLLSSHFHQVASVDFRSITRGFLNVFLPTSVVFGNHFTHHTGCTEKYCQAGSMSCQNISHK